MITFNSAIQDGADANGLADISVELVAQPVVTPMTTTEIVNTINSSAAIQLLHHLMVLIN